MHQDHALCLPRCLEFAQSVLGLEEFSDGVFLHGTFGAELEFNGFELAGSGGLAFEGVSAFGFGEFFLCFEGDNLSGEIGERLEGG